MNMTQETKINPLKKGKGRPKGSYSGKYRDEQGNFLHVWEFRRLNPQKNNKENSKHLLDKTLKECLKINSLELKIFLLESAILKLKGGHGG